jgi:queuosine precursor transporter
MKQDQKLNLLIGLYVGALYASNLLGGKLMPIGFGGRGLTVSIIMFPLLFLITDIVGEVYGRKKSNEFVKIGLISLLFLLAWQLFSISVPGAVPNEWYATFNESYRNVFALTITFTIASIIAFLTGQYTDVLIYHFMKNLNKGKMMWLRNNVSTIVGQFIDSSVWALIAFFPLLLNGTFSVFSLYGIVIIPYWLAKVVIALIDTPLAYLGVKWLKKED